MQKKNYNTYICVINDPYDALKNATSRDILIFYDAFVIARSLKKVSEFMLKAFEKDVGIAFTKYETQIQKKSTTKELLALLSKIQSDFKKLRKKRNVKCKLGQPIKPENSMEKINQKKEKILELMRNNTKTREIARIVGCEIKAFLRWMKAHNLSHVVTYHKFPIQPKRKYPKRGAHINSFESVILECVDQNLSIKEIAQKINVPRSILRSWLVRRRILRKTFYFKNGNPL